MLTQTFDIERRHNRVSLKAGAVTLLEQRCEMGRRPFIHPLRPLDGAGVLTEDSPEHHPWQHGLYTGYHAVNGSDFWLDQGKKTGRIEPRKPELINDHSWSVCSLWRHHEGHDLLKERQIWSAHLSNDCWYLDLKLSFEALVDVHIEQGKYGGLFLRMPWREDKHAQVVNNCGFHDDDCEQAAADWVALHMDIDGRDNPAGIAILDHPENTDVACKWRVDHQRGINPCPVVDQPIDIAEGQQRTWHYRVLVFNGSTDARAINAMYQEFIREQQS